MSIETYLFIQSLVLVIYGSWIAYRVGYAKGKEERNCHEHR
jgi:hypothetical protein